MAARTETSTAAQRRPALLGGDDHQAQAVIKAEQTRLLFAQGRAAVIVTLCVSSIVVWASWGVVDKTRLLVWLAAVFVASFARWGVIHRFEQLRPDDPRLWGISYGILVSIAGGVFGAAGVLFTPYGGFEYKALLTFVLAGMALGAIPILGSVRGIYATYACALCLPMVIHFIAQGGETAVVMVSLATLLAFALFLTARNYHRSLLQGLNLAAVNVNLQHGLSNAHAITEEVRRREALLRENQARLTDFAALGADLFWESDVEHRYIYLSEGYEQLIGFPAADIIGARLDDRRVPRLIPEELAPASAEPVEPRPFGDFRVSWNRPDQRPVVLLSNGKPIVDEEGHWVGYRGTVRDVTYQHQLSEQLRHQASHDELTGLINRREFDHRLHQTVESAWRTGSTHALCYLDLDQFKVVNDTCGHEAGDELLRQLAQLISSQIRSRDTFARLGGDEFGVLMEHCSSLDAATTAEQIRRSVESYRFAWQEASFGCTVSIGVAPINATSGDVGQLMGMVDAACYAAKEGGRNRVSIVDIGDDELVRRRSEMKWVTRLTQAIEEDRLELMRQSIAALNTPDNDAGGPLFHEHGHFELLLRMRDEDGGIVLPSTFLPAAERYSLSTKVDRWVITKALLWLQEPSTPLDGIHMCAINLSGHSLMDPDFLAFVVDALESTSVPLNKLCFEITETAAITNLATATDFVRKIKALGCQFALDDFGSGLSSFGYLKNFPVDYLKIDGQFVREMVDDPLQLAMVKSMNDIGKLMGKKTIAEFVETEELLALVAEIGLDYAQGYAIDRPRPIT